MKRKALISALVVVFATICFSKSYGANGTMIDGVGAKSMGMGGAFTAIADDTSSTYHNPAGIARQEGKTLEVGVNLLYPRSYYADGNNPGEDSKRVILPLPQFGFVNKEENSEWGWGIGAFTAAGLKVDYSLNNSVFNYQPYESSLALTKVVPTIAYGLTPKLCFGAGLNFGIQDFDLELPYVIQTGALAGTTALADIKTSGEGLGGIFGLLYEIDDKTTIGLTYTTKMDVHLEGQTPLTLANGLSGEYDVDIDYRWPQTIAVGLAHQPSSKLLLASDVVWIDWSGANDKLILKLSDGTDATINASAGSSCITDILPLNWKDRFVFHFGTEYYLNQEVTLRAGYSYGKSPIPDSALVPVLATILEHTISLGIGYKGQQAWEYNLAYQYSFSHSQSTNQSDISGGDFDNSKNKLNNNSLIFTIAYHF